MTSTTTAGLPDRYRPLDQVGPDEPTPTGVIRSWRAKDRVLNRDVAIRVHTPAGPAAHAWISRALTAGGLATPALAMVYDASEGTESGPGDEAPSGGAAYVVNEWIDGETLAERLSRGPLPERDARVVVRRLAEGVAEAHRVGLAVGGLSPENVVLRPNGLVGLRAVPAATGTIDGDIAALGALLEACLTGLEPAGEARALTGPPDLVALVRRARSTEAGQGLSSVAAMAALLAERPRAGSAPRTGLAGTPATGRSEDSGGSWLQRLLDRRTGPPAAEAEVEAGPVPIGPHTLPPVPTVRPVTQGASPLSSAALGGDTIDAGTVAPSAGAYAGPAPSAPAPSDPAPSSTAAAAPTRSWGRTGEDEPFDVLHGPPPGYDGYDDVAPEDEEDGARRHRLVVIGVPLLALALVVALAWWIGDALLSVSGSVEDDEGSTPPPAASAPADGSAPAGPDGGPASIVAADVFDPEGDGEPENDRDVPLAYDGDPGTAWSTLSYRGSPDFGNLKPGVGLLVDLGEAQQLAGVTLASTLPGATVEIRTGNTAGEALDDFDPVAEGTVESETELALDEPVEARYVLVWVTGLVPADGGFRADLAEIAIRTAG